MRKYCIGLWTVKLEMILKGVHKKYPGLFCMYNANTSSSSKPKGVRLGYMGHLMLISEDVITALARFPPDLRLIIIQHAPEPEWDQYVTGRYNETKEEDARPLGGGKPIVVGNGVRGGGVMQWKVDENDLDVGGSGTGGGEAGDGNGGGGGGGGFRGEFRRASSVGPSSGHVTSTADFGPAPMDEDEDDDDDDSVLPGRAPHVCIYISLCTAGFLLRLTLPFPLVRSISSSRNIFRSFRVII